MQRASVGRVVHYRAQPEEAPQLALICHVDNPNDPDTTVNLLVVSSVGKTHAEQSVGRNVGAARPSWDWPDFVPPFGGEKAEQAATPTSPNVVATQVVSVLEGLGFTPAMLQTLSELAEDEDETPAEAEAPAVVEAEAPAVEETAPKPTPKRVAVKK